MRTTILTTGVLVIATAALSFAQDKTPRQRWPGGGDRGGQTRQAGGGDQGGAQPRGGGERAPAGGAQPRERQGGGSAERPSDVQRRGGADLAERERERARAAEPRLRRPDSGSRVAVPRPVAPPRVDGGRYGPSVRRYDPRPYPPRYRSYGFGPSYFFYADPFYRYPSYRYPNRNFAWSGDFGGYGFGYATGELKLEVRPQHAEVYVDGYYAGVVDDFDGFAQSLRLEEGPYHIEIVADGYESAAFDVRIQPGRRISFERDLRPESVGY